MNTGTATEIMLLVQEAERVHGLRRLRALVHEMYKETLRPLTRYMLIEVHASIILAELRAMSVAAHKAVDAL